MLTPIELIKAVVDGMIARRFGRIVNITSGAVKNADRRARPVERRAHRPHRLRRRPRAPDGAAQRHHQRPAARPVRHRPPALEHRVQRQEAGQEPRRAGAGAHARPIPAGRFGTIEEFGDACAYLCSAQAGFITGQNFLHRRWRTTRARSRMPRSFEEDCMRGAQLGLGQPRPTRGGRFPLRSLTGGRGSSGCRTRPETHVAFLRARPALNRTLEVFRAALLMVGRARRDGSLEAKICIPLLREM